MVVLGLVLLILGLVIVAVESHVPMHGFLAIPGTAAIAVGTVIAVSDSGGGLGLGLAAALLLVSATLSLAALSVRRGVEVRHRRIRSGREAMTGRIGVVTAWTGCAGKVALDGGLWSARPEHRDDAFDVGERVVVDYICGLTLTVHRAEEWEMAEW
jgi:membrane-bound serine protease (ClpP class)